MYLTIKLLNTRTAALLPSVSQCRPELDMNFEISKSEQESMLIKPDIAVFGRAGLKTGKTQGQKGCAAADEEPEA